jgi:hypothetical protein
MQGSAVKSLVVSCLMDKERTEEGFPDLHRSQNQQLSSNEWAEIHTAEHFGSKTVSKYDWQLWFAAASTHPRIFRHKGSVFFFSRGFQARQCHERPRLSMVIIASSADGAE